ncbi:hypothetical protein NCCP2495_12210 [Dietzia sp. NCCP-2495]|nr:hypothetical protein NCCP2495_12210 [Dietzia sp. NCCP-2495]
MSHVAACARVASAEPGRPGRHDTRRDSPMDLFLQSVGSAGDVPVLSFLLAGVAAVFDVASSAS